MADPLPEIADLPLERRVALTSGADTWHHRGVPEADVPALRVSDGPNGARGLGIDPAETSVCFPVGSCLAATWDVDLAEETGRGAGRRDAGQGRRCGARADGQPAPPPTRRPELRVLLRGSASRLSHGRAHHPRAPGPWGRRLHEALRRQRVRVPPPLDVLGDRRANASRGAPRRVRGRGRRGRHLVGDVVVQPAQRHVRERPPLAAHRAAARRVGLRRRGDLRLGRHDVDRSGDQRRLRPGDARTRVAGPRTCPAR